MFGVSAMLTNEMYFEISQRNIIAAHKRSEAALLKIKENELKRQKVISDTKASFFSEGHNCIEMKEIKKGEKIDVPKS